MIIPNVNVGHFIPLLQRLSRLLLEKSAYAEGSRRWNGFADVSDQEFGDCQKASHWWLARCKLPLVAWKRPSYDWKPRLHAHSIRESENMVSSRSVIRKNLTDADTLSSLSDSDGVRKGSQLMERTFNH